MVRVAGCAERWDRIGIVPHGEWREALRAVVSGASVATPPGAELVWLDEACALAPHQPAPGNTLGLRIRAYTLVVLGPDEQLLRTLPLGGARASDVSSWIAKQGFVGRSTGDFPDAPPHELLANLDRTLSNVHHTLGRVVDRTQGASAVRTAPETLATIATIQLGSREGESPRVIELGFTPEPGQGEIFVRSKSSPGNERAWRIGMDQVAAMSDVDAQATVVERFLHDSLEEAYDELSRQWQSRRPSTPP
ncbi:MAG: hypothetical protein AAF436_18620 [Myxococcota bacterium]